MKFAIFRLKINFIFGILLFLICSKEMFSIKKYSNAFVILLTGILISGINSPNIIAWGGFVVFYIFTYFAYFIVPVSLMRVDCASVMRVYTASFIAMGTFSLAQVFFSFFGIELPFVTQTIGSIARGQAWTYEPSFFALYMTPFIAFENARYFLMPEKRDRFIVLYNLMFLSSTSTGCFFTYVWMLLVFVFFFRNNGLQKWKKLIAKCCFLLVSMFCAVGLFLPSVFNSLFKFFYGGFFAHDSFWCRWRGLVRCWDIFKDHPFFGVGLGGISSYSAEKYFGGDLDLLDPAVLDTYPGMNVTTEVLANLGLFGAFSFVYLFYLIYKDFADALRIPMLTKEERVNLQAFAISLCVTAFTYQFSQSIMRSYIWVHIAICIGYVYSVRKKYAVC